MDWLGQIKSLRARRRWTYFELARHLGISTSLLQEILDGRTPIPSSVKVRLIDHRGYVYARATILSLLPDDVASALRSADNSRYSQALRDGADEEVERLLEALENVLDVHRPEDVKRIIMAFLGEDE